MVVDNLTKDLGALLESNAAIGDMLSTINVEQARNNEQALNALTAIVRNLSGIYMQYTMLLNVYNLLIGVDSDAEH